MDPGQAVRVAGNRTLDGVRIIYPRVCSERSATERRLETEGGSSRTGESQRDHRGDPGRIRLTAGKGPLRAANVIFHQQRGAERVRPPDSDIEGRHGVSGSSRNVKRQYINHVEAIVAEEHVILAADLLVNAKVVVIRSVYVGSRGYGV